MDGIRGNSCDQPFKCSICQGDDGGTTNKFAGRLQVRTSCTNGCQLHLGCVLQQTGQQPLKLDQRRCSECQTLPVLPLLCESKSVQEHACDSENWQALTQILKINFDRGINIHLDKRLLSIALEKGNSKCLDLLCMAGANVNAVLNKSGATPLHMAACYGDTESLKVLLKIPEVNVSALENDDSTPLHCVAIYDSPRHTDCLKLLIAHPGVDVNAKDIYDRTPLHWAASGGNTDNLKWLLTTRGIDINATCGFGLTPLHHAASRNQIDYLEELLCAGAIVNATEDNNIGRTPLDIAKSWKHHTCAERLIARRAKTRRELKALEEEARKEQECRLI